MRDVFGERQFLQGVELFTRGDAETRRARQERENAEACSLRVLRVSA
jgi:hypothetical protein